MADRWEHLPEECWELVFVLLESHHHQHFEALSLVCKRFLSISNRLRSTLIVSDSTIIVRQSIFPLLQRFQQLKQIDLAEFHGDLDRIVTDIARSGLNLEALNISNQLRFPVKSMMEWGWKMKKTLRILICSRICFLQDSDLIAIADSFSSLEELDISYPEHDFGSLPEISDPANDAMDFPSDSFPGTVTDAGIAELSSKLRRLHKINLSGNHFISDQSLIALSSNCEFLSEIAARDCSFISQNGIASAIRQRPNLISLSVNGSKTSPFSSSSSPSFTIESSLVYARALHSIDFSQMAISNDILFSIGEARLPLQKFSLSHCRGFTFAGISSLLCIYKSLKHLDLEGADFFTDQSITELSHYLCKLTSINFNSCSNLTNLTLFNLTRNCPYLEELRMERTSLGIGDIPTDLVKNPRIQSLILAWNKYLHNDTLAKLGSVSPKLRLLNVSHCWNITEEGIRAIGMSCPEIKELEVNGCDQMRNLGMDSNIFKLEVLRAAGSGIEDQGLLLIAQNCQGELMLLDLEACLGVTDKGVQEVVRNCKRLKEVNLKRCCNVSVDVLAWMVFIRPSLRKIIPPSGFVPTEKQRNLFLHHGCMVGNG